MTPAIYNLPEPVRRGDTMQGWEIAKLTHDNGDPVGIASARMQLRSPAKQVVYEWSTANERMLLTGATATLNTLTLQEVAASETANWPIAVLNYDLEVTFDTGEVGTVLAGTIAVAPDITR